MINEAAAFFKSHLPCEIVYDPALTQGKIDHARETVPMSFQLKIIATSGMKIIADLCADMRQGLEKLSDRRKELARVFDTASWQWPAALNVNTILNAIPYRYDVGVTLVNENGETIGNRTWSLQPEGIRSTDFSSVDYTLEFPNVNADKITDKMTLSIVSVNGIDANAAGQRGYMSISVEDFKRPPFIPDGQFEFGWFLGGVAITGYNGPSGNLVIPSRIASRPVTIGRRAFKGDTFNKNNILTSVTIGNGITSIGLGAFCYNRLTSVTIPDSVKTIGREAFNDNRGLDIVTMPANVELGFGAVPCQGAYEATGRKAGTYRSN
jgi:hypothetical protein